jgi:hypothetical protein
MAGTASNTRYVKKTKIIIEIYLLSNSLHFAMLVRIILKNMEILLETDGSIPNLSLSHSMLKNDL